MHMMQGSLGHFIKYFVEGGLLQTILLLVKAVQSHVVERSNQFRFQGSQFLVRQLLVNAQRGSLSVRKVFFVFGCHHFSLFGSMLC